MKEPAVEVALPRTTRHIKTTAMAGPRTSFIPNIRRCYRARSKMLNCFMQKHQSKPRKREGRARSGLHALTKGESGKRQKRRQMGGRGGVSGRRPNSRKRANLQWCLGGKGFRGFGGPQNTCSNACISALSGRPKHGTAGCAPVLGGMRSMDVTGASPRASDHNFLRLSASPTCKRAREALCDTRTPQKLSS